MANSYSRSDREFEKAPAMLFPSEIAQRGRMHDHTAAHFRRRVSVVVTPDITLVLQALLKERDLSVGSSGTVLAVHSIAMRIELQGKTALAAEQVAP